MSNKVDAPIDPGYGGLPSMLIDGAPPAGVRCIFPPGQGHCSLVQALRNESLVATPELRRRGISISENLSTLLSRVGKFERVSHCPVVAITGLLNAGKSSLLATYLSPKGRRRVLRGVGNLQGTHRFVIWLPLQWWTEAELLNSLVAQITEIFGHPPEQLSDDPAIAQEQYNGRVDPELMLTNNGKAEIVAAQVPVAPYSNALDPRATSFDPIAVPLIASDVNLDTIQMGLVDCPDIQTGYMAHTGPNSLHGSELAKERREQLGKVGRLCSAFIVVSKLSSLHDEGLTQLLATLRDTMPGVPRILAINKIKARYATSTITSEARGLVDRFGIAGVFAAYDYRSTLAADLIPPAPTRMHIDPGSPQPIFFAIDREASVDGNSPVKARDPSPREYLFDLSKRLDAGTLTRESRRSLALQLKDLSAQTIDWVEANSHARLQQIEGGWQAIADACYEFMAERDAQGHAVGLRLQASPSIVGQLADSFQRTAPAWMRISMTIDRTVRQFQTAIANKTSQLTILQAASGGVTRFIKSFKRGEGAQVVTPKRLADAIRICDRMDAFASVDDSRLLAACEAAMKRFSAEDKAQLDPGELDKWSREVWENMPLKQKLWKGAQPLALLMGPLLAAVLVPIDGGGTAVLVFASLKELVAAAGIAAIMTTTVSGREAIEMVHRETPWRQLSDLFALVCDCVGIPRPIESQLPGSLVGNEKRKLLPSGLPVRIPNPDVLTLSLWGIEEEFVRKLRAVIMETKV